jgi:hypothetical protein
MNMKTLVALANDLMDEIHAVDTMGSFFRPPTYQLYVVLRLIKSSSIVHGNHSFDWDQIRLFQDTLDLLEEGPPTRLRYEAMTMMLNREDA